MPALPVTILDKDAALGQWLLKQLEEIGITARQFATASALLADSENTPPVVCLVALRAPVSQVLTLIGDLTQEPRFARTSFILMGPMQHKRGAFEAGADDYLITPPDVIELRKRVRLYLDRAELEERLRAEVRISQEIATLSEPAQAAPLDAESVTLLEHSAALAQERDLLAHTLTFADVAIALIDLNGTVRYANPAWCQIMGCDAAAANGLCIDWPPRTENPSVSQEIGAAIARRIPWGGEFCTTNLHGRRLDLAMSLTPALDSSQAVTGFVTVLNDVGRRREIDKLKTQFLSDAAFEMRTPVTNIKMREYLLRQAPQDQHAMHLEALEREVNRLAALVDAMLELARMDADLVEMAFEDTDLNRLAADLVVRYDPTAREKGVTLALSRMDTLAPVRADPLHLMRALGVLVENAILYTPEGGHIDLRLGQETWTGGAFATIQVQDTGIGIPPDALPHIFERFYRGERSRDSAIRGVGLGLPIAQKIINMHNGDITVESHVSRGSAFTVWLPVRSES